MSDLEAMMIAAGAKVTYMNTQAFAEETKPKRNKHGNVKTEYDGRRFDSKAECRRYVELKAELQAGIITELELQRPFAITINNQLICEYRADFVYRRNGVMVVEDVKSNHTRNNELYRLKKKLMKIIIGIEIVEVIMGRAEE